MTAFSTLGAARRAATLFALVHLVLCTPSWAQGPVAPREPRDVTVHGDVRIDDYYWLREKENPKVMAHLRAEAAHTESWFEPLKPLTATLYGELVGRIQQSDEAVPVREGAWWYSTRTEEGKQYQVLTRRAAKGPQRAFDPAAKVQVLLDLNAMAQGQAFLSVGSAVPSPDGRLLAYTVDYTGARDFELRIRDLASGADLPWKGTGVSSFAWSSNGRHLFYVRQNDAMRSDTLWRHDLSGGAGSQAHHAAGASDTKIFHEPDTAFNLWVNTSDDRRYVVMTTSSKDTTEQHLLDAAQPTGAWRVVLPRQTGIEYEATPQGSGLYLRINDRGPNFRLVRLESVSSKGSISREVLETAIEVIPHRLDASIDTVRNFRTHLVAQVREGGSVRLRVMDHAQRRWREIGFPEPVYVAQVVNPWQPRSLNLEYDTDRIRLSYTSLLTPVSVYETSLSRPGLTLLKRQPVLGGYDPARLQARRLTAKATDGTDVPISMVFSRSLRGKAPQPMLLLGYGSYGIPSDPAFSSALLSLIERGVIVAIAHVRGGGDLGRHWYQQGKLDRKMNTFTDFIAVADHLVSQGYTEPSKLIINGGSAGGLLMGAVTNLRPDLFKAVVADVPFVDVINTMLDESLPLTTEEFIEWGNPKVAEQYAWMRAYSPYDNLKSGPYPAILARTALNDSQVPYWEAAKYVARLRTLKTNDTPLLLDINMSAGHGGASGRYDALRERARVYAFMLSQWGLAQ